MQPQPSPDTSPHRIVPLAMALLLALTCARLATAQTPLAHWNFSTGTSADLTANGHTLAPILGADAIITYSADAGGYVSLSSNALLVDTSINSIGTPLLATSATYIITMRYDAAPTTQSFNWGLFDNTTFTGTDWAQASFVGMSDASNQSLYINGPAEMSRTLGTPVAGTWYTFLVRYDATANNGTGALHIYAATNNDGVISNTNYIVSMNLSAINPWQAFGLGKLKSAAGVAMSFADVQIYDGFLDESVAYALANASIATTTQAIPEPAFVSALAAFAALTAAVLTRRRRIRSKTNFSRPQIVS